MFKQKLKSKILGQEHVFDVLERYIKIGEAEIRRKNQTRGTFLFTGPTGTGKTETTKVLAQILSQKLIRFDMSEYQNREKFLGDLASRVADEAGGIILLDEIEKGNMEIFDYFLQILSEATITHDRKVYNLSKYYIFFTSNIGSRNIMDIENFAVATRIVERLVKSHFRPEFLGRIPKKCQICFRPLEYKVLEKIVEQKVKMEIAWLQEKGYYLEYDANILSFLMDLSISPESGARDCEQIVQEHIGITITESKKTTGKLVLNSFNQIEIV
jgi:ATP-dependent Clp protease ATP-binding subunit ClpB